MDSPWGLYQYGQENYAHFEYWFLERKESPSDDVIKNCKNMEDLQNNQGIKQD